MARSIGFDSFNSLTPTSFQSEDIPKIGRNCGSFQGSLFLDKINFLGQAASCRLYVEYHGKLCHYGVIWDECVNPNADKKVQFCTSWYLHDDLWMRSSLVNFSQYALFLSGTHVWEALILKIEVADKSCVWKMVTTLWKSYCFILLSGPFTLYKVMRPLPPC